MKKHLWKVWVDNQIGEIKVVTFEKGIREVVEVCEQNDYDRQVSIDYIGEVID